MPTPRPRYTRERPATGPLLFPIALVAIGGAAGTALRHAAVDSAWRPALTVLILNVLGSALLGALVARRAPTSSGPNDAWTALVGVGFCGGLTTFSTHAADVAMRLDQQQWSGAFESLIGTSALCVGAAALAHRVVSASVPESAP